MQKQTELTLPVNTRSSEIKVTFPKFVCLYSRLNIHQYNIHTRCHPRTCNSRWATTLPKPINLIQIYSQHTTLFACRSEKYFCVARFSVFKELFYVKILLVVLLLLFQWTMAVSTCRKPWPFFQQDKLASLKLCQKPGANSSYHPIKLWHWRWEAFSIPPHCRQHLGTQAFLSVHTFVTHPPAGPWSSTVAHNSMHHQDKIPLQINKIFHLTTYTLYRIYNLKTSHVPVPVKFFNGAVISINFISRKKYN